MWLLNSLFYFRQFPFIAEIGTRDWGSCGASIVNAHWVITGMVEMG